MPRWRAVFPKLPVDAIRFPYPLANDESLSKRAGGLSVPRHPFLKTGFGTRFCDFFGFVASATGKPTFGRFCTIFVVI